MTRETNMNPRFIRRLVLAGLTAIALAGCAAAKGTSKLTTGYDYRQNHPIKVMRERLSLSITLPAKGLNLSPGDSRRIRAYINTFVRRGRSAVTVESAQPKRVRAILMANGLHKSEIILLPNTTVAAPNAILNFTANKVVAPECGNWTSPSSFDPMNKPQSNFGCAYQRDIGLVVSDPGDFIQAQPSSGGAASRSDESIRTFNSGAPMPRLLDNIQPGTPQPTSSSPTSSSPATP